jgi:NADPH-dependent glutamate synthase beta subunit-like oxidoreductase/Pyruvate/2-oxoacid:ferredoxin oxidoreductase delta subunit
MDLKAWRRCPGLQQTESSTNTAYACGTEAISVNKTGEWRFLTPERLIRLSPCRQSCLLDGEIPSWLEAVKKEKWEEAWQIMSRNNPFPALTGYVCFNPCQDNCNRGQLDQGIEIREVEKAIGEWRHNHYEPQRKPKLVKKRIAVIGSGPAGLSCAYYLAEANYAVTVFERSDQIGGMLALGIPEYRLPRKILKKELEILKSEGIEFKVNSNLGSDFTLDDLYHEFDEVFLATGAWIPRLSGITGEDSKAVFNALDFLSSFNAGNALPLGSTVVVVGGGDAAIDSARSALRINGVHHVSLLYRRSRIEMPADQSEVETAEREGVELIFNVLPRKIVTAGQTVKAIELDHSRTERNGLVVDCSNSLIKECDAVIMALGQVPDYSVLGPLKTCKTVYAGGDLITGPATVPDAIRAGRLAATAIRAAYEDLPGPDFSLVEEQAISFEELNLAAKVNLELQQKEANPVKEAERCLGCGTCNSCGICYLFCPDLAVDQVNGRFEFNLDYCKGCGICVKECPSRALVMEGGGK